MFPYSDSIEKYNVQTIPKRDIESKLINKIPDKERQREGFNIYSKNKFVFISTEKKMYCTIALKMKSKAHWQLTQRNGLREILEIS